MNNFWLQNNSESINVLMGNFVVKFNYNHSIHPSEYVDYNKTGIFE